MSKTTWCLILPLCRILLNESNTFMGQIMYKWIEGKHLVWLTNCWPSLPKFYSTIHLYMIQNILVSKLALCDCASLTLELHKLLPRQGPQNPFYFGWENLKNVVKLLRGKAFTSSRSRLTIMSPYYKLCLLWLRLYIKVIVICISTKMSPLFTKYPIRLALSHLALTGLQPLSLGHSHFNPGSLNSQNMTTDWFDCVILNQVTGNMNILIVKRSSLWYRIQGLYQISILAWTLH